MIAIKVNNKELDLKANTKIRFQLVNSIFDGGDIKGSFSFPINIPISATNSNALGAPEIVDNKSPLTDSWPCQVFDDGMLLYEGSLALLSVTDSDYRCTILVGAGSFADKNKNKKLVDLNWDTYSDYTFIQGAPVHNEDYLINNNDYPLSKYCLPTIANAKMLSDDFSEFEPIVPNPIGIYNTPDSNLPGQVTVFNIAFLYVKYILDKIFEESNYSSVGAFDYDKELRKLVLYNNFVNVELSSDTTTTYEKRILKNGVNDLYLGDLVPDVGIHDFILSVKVPFNLGFFFNHTKKQCEITPLKDVLNSTEYDDWTDKLLTGYEISRLPFEGLSLSYSESGTDSLLTDFDSLIKDKRLVKAVADKATLIALTGNSDEDVVYVRENRHYYIYDSSYSDLGYHWKFLTHEELVIRRNSSLTIGSVIDNVNSYEDLTAYAGMSEFDIIYIIYTDQYWIYKKDLNPDNSFSWHFLADGLEKYDSGNAKSSISAIGSTIGMFDYDARLRGVPDSSYTNNSKWRVLLPLVGEPIRSKKGLMSDTTRAPIRFLFWRGYRYGKNYDPSSVLYPAPRYPMVSSNVYDSEGNKIANYSLDWNGPTGLYQTWWNDWIEFQKRSKPIEFKFVLNKLDIANLNMARKKKVSNRLYFIHTIDLEAPIKGVATVKMMPA